MEINEELLDVLFSITVKLPNGQIISGSFKSDVEVKDWYDTMEEELSSLPSRYVFWSAVLTEQKHKVAIVEKQIQRRRSKLCEKFINDSSSSGGKIHKYLLDELVEADDKMLELESRLMAENKTCGKLWDIVNFMRMKSDHLRTLAGFKKQELRDS